MKLILAFAFGVNYSSRDYFYFKGESVALLKSFVVAAALTACALSAHAQVGSRLDYSLALADSAVDGYFYDSDPTCNYGSEDNRYRTMSIQVTTSGSYRFYDNGYEDSIGQDGTLGIFSGAFNPSDLGAGCAASIDDDHTVTLAAGTYTLVMSSYDGVDGDIPGTFRYTVTGPALIGGLVPVQSAVTAVPTLSEWSLMLLGLGAAGFGMRRLRRKA